MAKKEVIKVKKLEKGETFIKVSAPWFNQASAATEQSPYERIRWCVKALSKDETRVVRLLYIDETYIVATDGKRLHITWNEYGYSPGLYHVLLCNSKQIILERDAEMELKDYPKYQSVIPEKCKNGIEPFSYPKVGGKHDHKGVLSQYFHHVYTSTGKCYNIQFLEDALTRDSEHQFQVADATRHNKMLVVGIEGCNRLALIMPIEN